MKHLRIVRNATLLAALGLVGLGALDAGIPWFSAQSSPVTITRADDAQTPVELPRAYGAWWQVGDTWTVETVPSTRKLASSASLASEQPVRWQFTVEGMENREGVDYYRAKAKCVSEDVLNAPVITIWVDAKTSELSCISATLKIDEKREIKIAENYPESRAVITSFAIVPLELLAFVDKDFTSATKGVGDSDGVYLKTKRVESGSVRWGSFDDGNESLQKNIDTETPLNFKYHVDIEVNPLGTCDVSAPELCTTTLSTSFAHIEQTWRRNVPWPIKSDNGSVKSTLVKFERDGKVQYEREAN